ncbi:MAG: PspC domain-containing protein [Chloroflexi bacterium]|nr:PspC domain-containing protein [Chloroflexota bacterium]
MRERLYRSREERLFLGVAGGLAEWFDVDPSIVRLAFVLFSLAGGAGLIIYIAMAIFVPERPPGVPVRPGVALTGEPAAGSTEAGAQPRSQGDGRGALVFGVLLIVVGAWFLVRRAIPGIDLDNWWPVLLIGIGVVLLVGAARGKDSA